MNQPAKCRSCGREIVWKTTSNGKKVPLDPKALVFSVVGEVAVKPTPGVNGEVFMVSYFATCPDANKWHGKTRPNWFQEQHFSEPKETA